MNSFIPNHPAAPLSVGFLIPLFTLASWLACAAPGDVDLSFDPGSSVGPNDSVLAAVVLPSGKLLVAGSFSTVGGVLRSGIARLNPEGALDPSFNPVVGNYPTIYALALQADGKVLFSGYFSTVNGTNRNYIARLHPDGSLDASFDPGTGLDRPVRRFAIQPDGKILIGGWFSTVNGTSRNYVARLNANGSLDPSFNPGTGANDWVDSIALQSDGKVLVGGRFTSFNGTSRNYVVRLDANGAVDTSFNPGTGASFNVHAVALQEDGKPLITGDFGTFDGTIRHYVARLNTNGSLDTTFVPATTNIGRGEVILPLADGRIVIGGTKFPCCEGTRNNLVRLNSNGSRDSSFNPGAGVYTSGYGAPFCLALQVDGSLVVGGFFNLANGAPRANLARVDAAGNLDTNFNSSSGIAGPVRSIALRTNANLLVGGEFAYVGNSSRNGIAQLQADGSLDTSFNPGAGVGNPFAPFVGSIALQPENKVVIGGSFTTVNGASRRGIARLQNSGSLDGSFDPGTGASDEVTCIALQPDGKVIVGGWFYSFNGTNRSGIARLTAGGSLDLSFDPGFGASGVWESSIQSVALQADGKVVIGGYFTDFNGASRNGIARLNANGSLDSSFDPGTGFGWEPQDPENPQNPQVNCVTVLPDGKVLVGGVFNTFNAAGRTNIARLNVDGGLDSSFNAWLGPNFAVLCIALQPDGKVLLGGAFSAVNGTSRNGIARLNSDGSLDASFDAGTGANGIVYSIALAADGKVLIGGNFSAVNGVARQSLARLYGQPFPPSLSIAHVNSAAVLSWPATSVGFQLQETADLTLTDSWSVVGQNVVTNGGQISVSIPSDHAKKFFRLKSQ